MEAGLWLPHELHPFSNQCLPYLVCGMGLAGQDVLHRALRMGEQATEPFWLVKQEGGSLADGEATDKPSVNALGAQTGAAFPWRIWGNPYRPVLWGIVR